MKTWIEDLLKNTTMFFAGYLINSIINYLFLNDLGLSFLIELPKLAIALSQLSIWHIVWKIGKRKIQNGKENL